MDVFALTPEARAFYAAAAFRAAEELRLFAALPGSVEQLASRLGVRPRRLSALVGALAFEGLLAPGASPPAIPVPGDGWGRLAEVIRRDRPLDAEAHEGAFHAHLAEVGEAPARLLAARLREWADPPTLLDLGGGLGTYARAFVERGGSAVVVDRPAVITRAASIEPSAALEWVAADLFEVERSGFGVVLLCNVLHLYGAEDCARLCARAARSGRVVVVKDLDRRTAAGIWFALNMALYTESGDVHEAEQIQAWLGGGTVENMGDHIVVRGPGQGSCQES